MKLQTHLALNAHPNILFKTRVDPVGVEFTGDAPIEIATETIKARIGAVPFSIAMPFTPPHKRHCVLGRIGPFGIEIAPAQATIRAFGARIGGTIGTHGIAGETHLEGKCRLDADAKTDILGSVIKAVLEGALE